MEKLHTISSTALENFSFELRNTLSSAMGIINLLEVDEKLSKEGLQYINILRDSFDSLLDQIENYTCDSAIRQGKVEIPNVYLNELQFKDASVLLVDDNEVNNYIMKQLFNKFNIKVDIAYSGKEAIELYKQNDYDIVFMDYFMPGMNGVDTARHIRELEERGKNQLIIALSANVQASIKESFNNLGVELFIYKPVKLDQLCYILYRELTDKII